MPSVWIEKRRNKNGKNHLVQWEIVMDGRRVRGSESCGPSKRYALQRAEAIRRELYAGRTEIARTEMRIDLFHVLDRFLTDRKGARADTTYNHFIVPAVTAFKEWKKNCPIGMLSPDDAVGFRDHLLTAKKLSPTTAKMRLRDIRTAFSWAARKEIIFKNPFQYIGDLMPKTVPSGRYITPDEIGELLPALPDRVRRACYFALHQGVRKGELLALGWKQVFTRAIPWEAEILPGKTGVARIIRLHPNVTAMLGQPRDSGSIIPGLTEDRIDNHLPDATRRLGLGKIRFHDFRHTWATNFMWRTGNIFELMREGGWRSMTAMKVYQHYTRRENVAEYGPLPHYSHTNQIIRERDTAGRDEDSSTAT